MTTKMANKKNSSKETEMKRESKSETEKMTTEMGNKKNSSKNSSKGTERERMNTIFLLLLNWLGVLTLIAHLIITEIVILQKAIDTLAKI